MEKYSKQSEAAKLVSMEILGLNGKVVLVGGKRYWVEPPTIAKIAGAAMHLSCINDKSIHEVLITQKGIEAVAHALSWLIGGNDKLFNALRNGTFDECVEGIETAYSLISPQSFLKLSLLTRNVTMATAKPKQ